MSASYKPCFDKTQSETIFGHRNSGNGENDSPNEIFLQIAGMVKANYSTFTIQDFLSASRAADIDGETIRRLFNMWVKAEVKANRIKELPLGCYDQTTFQILTK